MNTPETLSEKTLVMLVGPSAIGKSTIMNEIIKTDKNFAYTKAFTTRQPRIGEQTHYTFISRQEATELQEAGQAITYIEHPTTHHIYGTTLESYPKRYNLLDTLSGSVAMYRALPFERTVTAAITAPSEQWQKWFLNRYPETTEEAKKRLDEAELSINWALSDPETYWVINREGATLQEAVAKIIDIILNLPVKSRTPDEPYAMLELIKKGVWHMPKK